VTAHRRQRRRQHGYREGAATRHTDPLGTRCTSTVPGGKKEHQHRGDPDGTDCPGPGSTPRRIRPGSVAATGRVAQDEGPVAADPGALDEGRGVYMILVGERR